MISKATALPIDYQQASAASQILPHPPLMTSENFGWNGIGFAHYRQPAWEIPEINTTRHTISVRLGTIPHRLEIVYDGRFQKIQQEEKATIEIYPANVDYKVGWFEKIEFAHCYLSPHLLSNAAYESVNSDQIELRQEFGHDPLIHQLILTLKTQLEINGTRSSLYAESISTLLSVHLLQHYSTYTVNLREYTGGLPRYKLRQAIDYIHTHLAKDISLEAIAQHLGISRYYFVRLFKQSMGITPHQYVLQQRIEQAKGLLQQRTLSLSAIALDCGFADQHHFSKQFRKLTGVTPKTYRESDR